MSEQLAHLVAAALRGAEGEDLAACFAALRPDWIDASLTVEDSRYLYGQAREAAVRCTGTAPRTFLEIGTGSGFSTSLLWLAGQTVGAHIEVDSLDERERCFFARDRPVGDFVKKLALPRGARYSHLNIHFLMDSRWAMEIVRNPVELLFIDGNHLHPWPSLDLLACLGVLTESATVVLHDVRLTHHYPQFQEHGAERLAAWMDVQPELEHSGHAREALPNIQGWRIREDARRELRRGGGWLGLASRLKEALEHWGHWETEIPKEYLKHVGIVPVVP